MDAGPIISEFMAINDHTLADEDREYPDWIEICNPTQNPVHLDGWHLTDDAEELTKWRFPAVTLAAADYLVVFASDKDRTDPTRELHTNFKLSGAGEYLALIEPDGTTIAHQFAPEFPPQQADISYGVTKEIAVLVSEGAELTYHLPGSADATLGTDWTSSDFDDSSWSRSLPYSPVLITEAATGQVDYLEIQNLSAQTADTAGWLVAVNDAGGGINQVDSVVWELPDQLEPGEMIYRTDMEGDHYWGGQIDWDIAGNGWVMIIDGQGNVADSVVWGYSAAEIASLRTSVGGFEVTLAGAWNGEAVPAGGSEANSLQRLGDWDRHNASNFVFTTPKSKGEQNSGLLTNTFPARTELPGVLVTEVGTGNIDYVEIQNLSDVVLDTAGWVVAVNYAQNADINQVTTTLWNLPGTIAPGEVLYRTDLANDNYWGTNIWWSTDGPGWVMIVDRWGNVADFVVWGYSETDIASLEVTVGGVQVTGEDAWSGPALPAEGTATNSAQRTGTSDHNNASDFAFTDPTSMGGQNAGLTADYPTGEQFLPVLITEVGTGNVDYVEIQNLSGRTIDTAGWVGLINDAGGNNITAFHPEWWDLPPSIASEEVIYRTDDPTDNYWGTDIPWETGGNGWAMIIDDRGHVADFVVWGYSSAQIDSLKTAFQPLDEAWSGPAVPAGGTESNSLKRGGTTDHDDTSDFAFSTPPSMGFQNRSVTAAMPASVGIGFSADAEAFGFPIQTDVRAAMHNVNASLWTRFRFEAEDPALFDELTLRIKDNDGFVAFLNGQPLALRNVDGMPEWNSTATLARSVEESAVAEEFDVSVFLFMLQEGPNMLAVQGLNVAADDDNFLLVPELITVNPLGGPDFFPTPSPGEPNGEGTAAPVGTPEFSRPGGTFVDPFDLVLAADPPEATIRYTLDGSVPGESSPIYSEPIRISTTTMVRAKAFLPGRPSGAVAGESYIGLHSSVAGFSSNLPLVVLDTHRGGIGEYEMSTVSSMFIETGEDGRVEITDTPQFSGRAGIQLRGSSSMSFPKKQYAFEVRDENDDDLAVSLLGMPEESDWILYAPYSDKTLMRNYLAYLWSNRIGQYAVRSRFVEVFLNTGGGNLSYSDYVGVYVFMEKIKRDENRVNIAELLPSHNSEPEITGGYIFKKDRLDPGDSGFYTSRQHFAYVEPKEREITSAQKTWLRNYLNSFESALYGANFTDPDNGYAKYINVDSFIDRHILVELTKNIDGFRLSSFFYKDCEGKLNAGPIWDFNLSLGNADYLEGWLSEGWYYALLSSDSYPYYPRLFQDPDFQQRYTDRWTELRRELFSTDRLLTDIGNAMNLLDEAQVRNFNRWRVLGTYVWPNWFIGDTYQEEISFMIGWLTDRLGWWDSQYVTAPTFSQAGGTVPPDFQLGIWAPAGTVYYTTDGSDPRLPGGAVSSTASAYEDTALTFDRNTRVHARARYGSRWSGLTEAMFVVEPFDTLRITELMYNPPEPTSEEIAAGFADSDQFEFIELVNTGTQELDLWCVRLADAVTFDFTSSEAAVLAPDERVVVADDEDAFDFRYDTTDITIAGEYSGRLANGGETLTLLDPADTILQQFTYDDAGRWPGRADGDGSSLEIVDINGDYNDPDNWRPSIEYAGSPGREGRGIDVVVNEVLTNTDGSLLDTIELYNTTDQAIDISGWYLSDSGNDYLKYRIPDDVPEVPARGYVTFDENDFNTLGDEQAFALDGTHGDDVWLVEADADARVTYFVDHVEFGSAANGESFGRWPDGSGGLYPMKSRTLRWANSGPRVGPVIISELHYNPGDAEAAGDQEFVEIHNPTNEEIDLTGWRIRGGIDFDFGEDTTFWGSATIPAHSTVVVVPFAQNDIDALVPFFTYYQPAEAIPLMGPFNGKLNNGGEQVQLLRPDQPPGDEPEFVPYLLEDEVGYDDQAPWPTEPDGTGRSLQRRAVDAWGNDAGSWTAGGPTPGWAFPNVEVVDRHVFYNNSSLDDAALELDDDHAIAPHPDSAGDPWLGKTPLLPNRTATFQNYTSYSRGINGIMIDLIGLPGVLKPTADDFAFRVGNNDQPENWTQAPDPQNVTIRRGEGSNGSDRITVIWPDGAIQNQWLEVRLVAANFGLSEDDVFYWGNAIGESGDSAGHALVNVSDFLAVRDNLHGFFNRAAITDAYDFNRDRLVNATDLVLARNHMTSPLVALRLITPLGNAEGEAMAAPAEPVPCNPTAIAPNHNPQTAARDEPSKPDNTLVEQPPSPRDNKSPTKSIPRHQKPPPTESLLKKEVFRSTHHWRKLAWIYDYQQIEREWSQEHSLKRGRAAEKAVDAALQAGLP